MWNERNLNDHLTSYTTFEIYDALCQRIHIDPVHIVQNSIKIPMIYETEEIHNAKFF